MSYQISRQALKDLEDIWLYTVENWSIEQADRYLNLIFDEIEYLVSNPQSGKDYHNVRSFYRASKVKSHIIFYKLEGEESEIEIIRILHERMDFESRLSE